MFKRLNARRLYKSFGVKGLKQWLQLNFIRPLLWCEISHVTLIARWHSGVPCFDSWPGTWYINL
jgi:hypothetical protein